MDINASNRLKNILSTEHNLSNRTDAIPSTSTEYDISNRAYDIEKGLLEKINELYECVKNSNNEEALLQLEGLITGIATLKSSMEKLSEKFHAEINIEIIPPDS